MPTVRVSLPHCCGLNTFYTRRWTKLPRIQKSNVFSYWYSNRLIRHIYAYYFAMLTGIIRIDGARSAWCVSSAPWRFPTVFEHKKLGSRCPQIHAGGNLIALLFSTAGIGRTSSRFWTIDTNGQYTYMIPTRNKLRNSVDDEWGLHVGLVSSAMTRQTKPSSSLSMCLSCNWLLSSNWGPNQFFYLGILICLRDEKFTRYSTQYTFKVY
jgi:hypothetical protein